MINHIRKLYGIRDPTPQLSPQEKETAPPLPNDHPCRDCAILKWHADTPYCFLPRCGRDIFKLGGEPI